MPKEKKAPLTAKSCKVLASCGPDHVSRAWHLIKRIYDLRTYFAEKTRRFHGWLLR